MKKSEAEPIVRHFCTRWYAENREAQGDHPSVTDFIEWLGENRSDVLNFRTTTSFRYDIELWFDDELGLNSFR